MIKNIFVCMCFKCLFSSGCSTAGSKFFSHLGRLGVETCVGSGSTGIHLCWFWKYRNTVWHEFCFHPLCVRLFLSSFFPLLCSLHYLLSSCSPVCFKYVICGALQRLCAFWPNCITLSISSWGFATKMVYLKHDI